MIEILKDKQYEAKPEIEHTEAFCVLDGQEILARCICKFEDNHVEFLEFSFQSPMIQKMFADGLIRAVLNAADLRGIPTAVCYHPDLFDILKLCNFERQATEDDIYMSLDITTFFGQGCCHKEKS